MTNWNDIMTKRPEITGAEMAKRAKRFGKKRGWGGNGGGWIYTPDGRCVAQGWIGAYVRNWRVIEAERESATPTTHEVEERKQKRAKRWRKTGVSDSTIRWMRERDML